jgi:hypothetical protein
MLDEPEIAAGRYLVDIDLWAVSAAWVSYCHHRHCCPTHLPRPKREFNQ